MIELISAIINPIRVIEAKFKDDMKLSNEQMEASYKTTYSALLESEVRYFHTVVANRDAFILEQTKVIEQQQEKISELETKLNNAVTSQLAERESFKEPVNCGNCAK